MDCNFCSEYVLFEMSFPRVNMYVELFYSADDTILYRLSFYLALINSEIHFYAWSMLLFASFIFYRYLISYLLLGSLQKMLMLMLIQRKNLNQLKNPSKNHLKSQLKSQLKNRS